MDGYGASTTEDDIQDSGWFSFLVGSSVLRFRGNAVVAGSTRYRRREMKRARGGQLAVYGVLQQLGQPRSGSCDAAISSRVAVSETFCRYTGYPPIARRVLPLFPTAAPRTKPAGVREPPADSNRR